MTKVMDVLHLVYKTYNYNPNSRGQLKLFANELLVKVKTPTRTHGRRWSPHLEQALQIIITPGKWKGQDDLCQYSFSLPTHVALS